jgi:hypothetical protein
LAPRCVAAGEVQGQKFVGTKVKLEYFGDQWEETTASETARQWTHHYIRPYDPIILVARWNVFSSRLLCTERRDIQKLLPPGTSFVYAHTRPPPVSRALQ